MSHRHLSPEQFMATYEPGDYGDEKGHIPAWHEVTQHPAFHRPLAGRDTHGGNFHELVASLKENGMREPVEVDDDFGQVLDGHHRVLAAAQAGVPVKFRPRS